MRKKLTALAALSLVCGGLVVVAVAPADAPSGERPAYIPRFTLDQARNFADFDLYYLGESFERLRLERIIRIDAKPLPAEPIRRNDVTFIYGWCDAGEDGCLPPLQVQIWDACQRHLRLYDYLPEDRLTLRGVPAATWEGGWRLELFTGRVTIVLFGQEPAQLRRAALALRGVNNRIPASEELPAPVPGAVLGDIANCR
jgi:hypothetical protein